MQPRFILNEQRDQQVKNKVIEISELFRTEKEEQGMQLVEAQQATMKSQRNLEFEKTCREQDIESRDAQIRDLQEQLVEYEEETIQLQN